LSTNHTNHTNGPRPQKSVIPAAAQRRAGIYFAWLLQVGPGPPLRGFRDDKGGRCAPGASVWFVWFVDSHFVWLVDSHCVRFVDDHRVSSTRPTFSKAA